MSSPVDYLLLGRPLPQGSLTLDILLDRRSPPAWIARAVSLLREIPGVILRRILLTESEGDTSPSAAAGPLFSAFHRLSVGACPLFQPAEQRAGSG